MKSGRFGRAQSVSLRLAQSRIAHRSPGLGGGMCWMLRQLAAPSYRDSDVEVVLGHDDTSYRSGNADGLARLGCAKAEKDKSKW